MCVHKFSFSWADALGWISWIICKCMLNFLVNDLYSKCTLPFYILSAMCAGSHFFTSSTLLDDVILNFNYFICVKWCLIVVLIHILSWAVIHIEFVISKSTIFCIQFSVFFHIFIVIHPSPQPILEHFYHSRKKLCTHQSVLILSSHLLAIIDLISICKDL